MIPIQVHPGRIRGAIDVSRFLLAEPVDVLKSPKFQNLISGKITPFLQELEIREPQLPLVTLGIIDSKSFPLVTSTMLINYLWGVLKIGVRHIIQNQSTLVLKCIETHGFGVPIF